MSGMTTKEFKAYLTQVKDPAKRKAIIDQLSPQGKADLAEVDRPKGGTKRTKSSVAYQIFLMLFVIGLLTWQVFAKVVFEIAKFVLKYTKVGIEWARGELKRLNGQL